jgi:hypothetical protein
VIADFHLGVGEKGVDAIAAPRPLRICTCQKTP